MQQFTHYPLAERVKIFSRKIFALEVGLGQEELQGITHKKISRLDLKKQVLSIGALQRFYFGV